MKKDPDQNLRSKLGAKILAGELKTGDTVDPARPAFEPLIELGLLEQSVNGTMRLMPRPPTMIGRTYGGALVDRLRRLLKLGVVPLDYVIGWGVGPLMLGVHEKPMPAVLAALAGAGDLRCIGPCYMQHGGRGALDLALLALNEILEDQRPGARLAVAEVAARTNLPRWEAEAALRHAWGTGLVHLAKNDGRGRAYIVGPAPRSERARLAGTPEARHFGRAADWLRAHKTRAPGEPIPVTKLRSRLGTSPRETEATLSYVVAAHELIAYTGAAFVWRGSGMDARADAVPSALRAVSGYVASRELGGSVDSVSVASSVVCDRDSARTFLHWLVGAKVLTQVGLDRYIVRAHPPQRWLPV